LQIVEYLITVNTINIFIVSSTVHREH
jgi:hypothetical protein